MICKTIPEILGESRGLLLLVISDADEVAGRAEWVPGDVEPTRAGEELVGVLAGLLSGYRPTFRNSLNLKWAESRVSLTVVLMVMVFDDADVLIETEDGAGKYTAEPTLFCKKYPIPRIKEWDFSIYTKKIVRKICEYSKLLLSLQA